jgi:hypothetical protein
VNKKFILWPDRPLVRAHCVDYIRGSLASEITWDVTIAKHVNSKSQEQLGYLWGVVLKTIADHIEDTTGQHYTTDDIYSWMIDEYGADRIVTINGKPKVTKQTASKMNTKEMSVFIEKVIQHAAMYMQLLIPDADKWR